jgi:L-threonylcarbamoyladenylate synthase
VKTTVLSAENAEANSTAIDLLRRGETVALPTETVYGLAADALNETAVLKIFAAKSRPRFDPLIVHLPSADWFERVAIIEDSVRATFQNLRLRFSPGPLTFILRRRPIVPDLVAAGLETVAVRISAHPIFAKIIREFGAPLAAPSANRFGRISPTTAGHVLEELEGLIPLIIDGGSSAHGLESTIVALRNGRIELLRRGPITEEELSEFGEVVPGHTRAQPQAPGQLPAHYAPRTPLILVDDPGKFARVAGKRYGLVSWKGEIPAGFVETRRLSENENLDEAAANLFRCLRELDNARLDLIVAEKIPGKGLGAAIMDRLQRAAATFDEPGKLQ